MWAVCKCKFLFLSHIPYKIVFSLFVPTFYSHKISPQLHFQVFNIYGYHFFKLSCTLHSFELILQYKTFTTCETLQYLTYLMKEIINRRNIIHDINFSLFNLCNFILHFVIRQFLIKLYIMHKINFYLIVSNTLLFDYIQYKH